MVLFYIFQMKKTPTTVKIIGIAQAMITIWIILDLKDMSQIEVIMTTLEKMHFQRTTIKSINHTSLMVKLELILIKTGIRMLEEITMILGAKTIKALFGKTMPMITLVYMRTEETVDGGQLRGSTSTQTDPSLVPNRCRPI